MRGYYMGAAVLASVLGLTGLTGIALGGSDRAELKKLDFTSERPGKPTGLVTRVNFAPANDDTAVRKIVTTLEDGTKVHRSVPERCTASNVQLIAQGAEACPEGSIVGDGVIEDSDFGTSDLTLFTNRDEAIVLAELRGSNPPARVVRRQKVADDRKLVIKLPEGFVLERAQLELFRIKSNGDGFIETPKSCPGAGTWTNKANFEYGDDVQQRERRLSPCDDR